MAVGVAVSTGGVRTYVSRAMSIGFAELLPLLLSYLVLIAAPAAAAGAVLLLQSRRERLRAEAAEEKLDQVQRHFRLAADGARAGVWTWRRDKDVVELSQRLSRMLGAPAESLTVPGFIALFVDEDRHKVQLAFAQARDRGALDVAVRANVAGKILFVELRGVAIEDPSAPELAAVVGTAIDITPRREAELRSLTQERRLKEAVESFSGPFALFDQRSRLLMWNRSFATLFQVPANLLRPGASYDAVMTAASSAIRRERHDPNDGQSREIELANGAWLQMVERRTAEGGLLAVGVEITPIKRQEEALIQKERNLRKLVSELERSEGRNKELARKYEEEKIKAEDASRAKTSFLANMSHELRTPLNAVIGFSDMMTKEIFGPLGSPRYKEYVRDIQHSGELLLDMINDILDTAKIEAGRMQIFPKPIDPMDPIEQAVRMVRPRADEKKLQLAVDAEDLPEEIVADFRTVKQMVLNLLSNALKFTESGGVMVRARPHRDGVMIQVIDTGPGIPEAFLSRLAQPFEQVDAELSRKHGGTGLGLAITKSFAEMHGGELHIESEVGKGTVVSIWLPNEAKAQAADVADAA
jgi:two-component system cell cycle sensor histidine kinase PleC